MKSGVLRKAAANILDSDSAYAGSHMVDAASGHGNILPYAGIAGAAGGGIGYLLGDPTAGIGGGAGAVLGGAGGNILGRGLGALGGAFIGHRAGMSGLALQQFMDQWAHGGSHVGNVLGSLYGGYKGIGMARRLSRDREGKEAAARVLVKMAKPAQLDFRRAGPTMIQALPNRQTMIQALPNRPTMIQNAPAPVTQYSPQPASGSMGTALDLNAGLPPGKMTDFTLESEPTKLDMATIGRKTMMQGGRPPGSSGAMPTMLGPGATAALPVPTMAAAGATPAASAVPVNPPGAAAVPPGAAAAAIPAAAAAAAGLPAGAIPPAGRAGGLLSSLKMPSFGWNKKPLLSGGLGLLAAAGLISGPVYNRERERQNELTQDQRVREHADFLQQQEMNENARKHILMQRLAAPSLYDASSY